MKNSFVSIAVSALLAFAVCFAPLAARATGSKPSKSNNTTPTYIILKVTDEKVDYRVIQTSAFKDESKRINEAYTLKLKEWHDEVKSNPKAPRPIKPLVKKLPTTFETQKGAQDYIDNKFKGEDGKFKEDEGKKDTDK
jgi:hypothetical protein